jgi:hypothetical protein
LKDQGVARARGLVEAPGSLLPLLGGGEFLPVEEAYEVDAHARGARHPAG